jgi:hypothetical protein
MKMLSAFHRMVENGGRTVIRVSEWFLWMRDGQEKAKVKSPTRKPGVMGHPIRLKIYRPGHPPGWE